MMYLCKILISCLVFAIMTIIVMGCSDNNSTNPRPGPGPGPSPVTFIPYLGEQTPGNTKVLFAEQTVPNGSNAHGTIVFTSNLREAFWSCLSGLNGYVYTSEFVDNVGWSDPEIASFSENDDHGPFISSNGERLYFKSLRPAPNTQNSVNTFWYTDRFISGWSEPVMMDEVFTNVFLAWQGSVDNQGNLYFCIDGSGDRDIYTASLVSGHYPAMERLSDSVNSTGFETAPYIAPDGSYLLFASTRPGGFGGSDIYVSFRNQNGRWDPAERLNSRVNTSGNENYPSVSPDGNYLFFVGPHSTTNRYYWIRLEFLNLL